MPPNWPDKMRMYLCLVGLVWSLAMTTEAYLWEDADPWALFQAFSVGAYFVGACAFYGRYRWGHRWEGKR